MIITNVRHEWPNRAGFCLNRENGHVDYSFVHFTTGVSIRLGGVEVDVPEHTCIIWRPGTPQYFYCENGMIHDWFHFKGVSEELFLSIGLPLDTLFHPKQSYFITDLVQEIESEYFAQRGGSEDMMDLKARELFIKLARSIGDDGTEAVDRDVLIRFRSLRKRMMQDLSHHWSVGEMARELSFSESRFYSLYRSFYGTSPIDDLIRARIDSAKSALLFTDHTVFEIAESLGYASVTHFCRQFRGHTGMTPVEYRKSKSREDAERAIKG